MGAQGNFCILPPVWQNIVYIVFVCHWPQYCKLLHDAHYSRRVVWDRLCGVNFQSPSSWFRFLVCCCKLSGKHSRVLLCWCVRKRTLNMFEIKTILPGSVCDSHSETREKSKMDSVMKCYSEIFITPFDQYFYAKPIASFQRFYSFLPDSRFAFCVFIILSTSDGLFLEWPNVLSAWEAWEVVTQQEAVH